MLKDILSSFCSPSFPESYFISFEGIEGAGKSTVIKKAQEFLLEKGFSVVLCREPGGTVFGENLRKAILESKEPIEPLSEALLFASSRAQLLREVILKNLQKKKTVVLCDRYIDSSLAYQGEARGLGVETILKIHSHAPLNTLPHRTYYISIDVKTSLERQNKRNAQKDYFESEKEHFYKKLVAGYEKAAGLFDKRICVIDGKQDEEKVINFVTDDLKKFIP